MAAADGHPFLAAAASAPELADWWVASMAPAMLEGGGAGRVPLRVKQLVRLRVEAQAGVRFPGLGDPADAGITPAEAAAAAGPLEALPAGITPAERAALALVDEIDFANLEGYLDEAMYAGLKQHFDDGAIFELGQATATLTGLGKFLRVYGYTG